MRRFFTYLLLVFFAAGSCAEKNIVIDDFESGALGNWIVEGNAFLTGPKNVKDCDKVKGVHGTYFLASSINDETGLISKGVITSKSFEITRNYINLLIGGSSDNFARYAVSAELLVDGETVYSSISHSEDASILEPTSWNVKEYKGHQGSIRISVDNSNGRFGTKKIIVDNIYMSNKKNGSFNEKAVKTVKITDNYLLIPSSNTGRGATLSILHKGENILGEAQSIVLAESEAEYNIPIDVSAYMGESLDVVISKVDDKDLTLSGMSQSSDRGVDFNEPYRPVYHFAPDFGWTNDPNGMVYSDGEYHLAYQANPYGTKHSNMHWGNAVSTDLVHWKDLPFIVAPDELGAIFSGSAVVDKTGSAGFGENAIIGMYTSASRVQRQSIAYSTDGGRTYTKYEGNPVLDEPEKQPNFRDPKLLRYENKWIVSIAAGDVIAFYESEDLKNWTKLSEFGKGIGSHAAVWECPDLMKFTNQGKDKWVLIVNINPGGPNGGSVAQYFIGDFNGKEFKADPLPYPLWIDEGVDNYAGVTFSNTGDRHIFLGWMSNWLYSNSVPTVYFRNAMTIARDLSLKHNGKHLFLASTPSPEIYSARGGDYRAVLPSDGVTTVPEILADNSGSYEIDFTITPANDNVVTLKVYNKVGEYMLYTFDFKALTLNLDRSRSGLVDFHKSFAKTDILTHLVKRDSYQVKLFADKHSHELFINDGDLTFTNCMFPTETYNSFEIVSGDALITEVSIHEIK